MHKCVADNTMLAFCGVRYICQNHEKFSYMPLLQVSSAKVKLLLPLLQFSVSVGVKRGGVFLLQLHHQKKKIPCKPMTLQDLCVSTTLLIFLRYVFVFLTMKHCICGLQMTMYQIEAAKVSKIAQFTTATSKYSPCI